VDYAPAGYWSLDRPSLATRWPNGLIAITDDWHHRIVIINPHTRRVVWSYGHRDQPGLASGYLNKPDGLDLLPAVPAGHTAARTSASRSTQGPSIVRASVARVGTLSQELSKAAAVGLPGGRLMVLGGETGGASTSQVLLGTPERLRASGRLPSPTARCRSRSRRPLCVSLRGRTEELRLHDRPGRPGQRRERRCRAAGHLDEPLSDLGAVAIDGTPYLVGGFTGTKFASAILRYCGGGKTTTVARLPKGTRYAGVAALRGRIYVAGGLTARGITDAV
jgi:hypothetical protein